MIRFWNGSYSINPFPYLGYLNDIKTATLKIEYFYWGNYVIRAIKFKVAWMGSPHLFLIFQFESQNKLAPKKQNVNDAYPEDYDIVTLTGT